MKVIELVEKLGLTVFAGATGLNRDVTGGYSSDLLSDVMGHASNGQVWITIQTHRNVTAIASLKDLAAVIITCGETPGEDTSAQSNEEGIPLLGTALSTFEIAGKLYNIFA